MIYDSSRLLSHRPLSFKSVLKTQTKYMTALLDNSGKQTAKFSKVTTAKNIKKTNKKKQSSNLLRSFVESAAGR